MSVTDFFIPILVVPKGNNKSIVRAGGFTKLVEPKRSRACAAALKLECIKRRRGPPITRPVKVTYVFRRKYRKADARKFTLRGCVPSIFPCDTWADLGNLTKQMDDALKLSGIIKDDKLIWSYGETRKVWDETTGVNVRIEEWTI